jgi:DNA-binding transcriptional ArsR family regulator
LTRVADPTRRRIVELLGEKPRTAGELHRAFPIADPAVSRHLRVLREAGLIVERRVPTDGDPLSYVRSGTVAVGCDRLRIGLFERSSKSTRLPPFATGCARWAP